MTSSRTDSSAARALGGLRCLLEGLQAEQDRRQRLTCLVVQLAREARPLQLLRLDDPPDGVPAHPLGEIDGDRSTGSERLRQTKVVLAEDRGDSLLVVGDHDPDRPSAHEQRHVQRRMDAESPRRLLIDLRIVQHRIDPSRSGHARGRALPSTRQERAQCPPLRRRCRPRPRRHATRHPPEARSEPVLRRPAPEAAGPPEQEEAPARAPTRARSRSRSATRTGAATGSSSRTTARSRSPRPPVRRGAARAPSPRP